MRAAPIPVYSYMYALKLPFFKHTMFKHKCARCLSEQVPGKGGCLDNSAAAASVGPGPPPLLPVVQQRQACLTVGAIRAFSTLAQCFSASQGMSNAEIVADQISNVVEVAVRLARRVAEPLIPSDSDSEFDPIDSRDTGSTAAVQVQALLNSDQHVLERCI
jgi:hypothetical protein